MMAPGTGVWMARCPAGPHHARPAGHSDHSVIPVRPELPNGDEGHDEAGNPADRRGKCPEAEVLAIVHETRLGSGSLALLSPGTAQVHIAPIMAAAGRVSMAWVEIVQA